jgi:succinate-semialdehyde dehydrogenase/glutarate-semialdehyde dehydrogenase
MSKMLIAGEWVEAASGEAYDVRDPASGEVVERVPRGTVEDARRAVDAAEAAWPAWSRIPIGERSRLLLRAAQRITSAEQELGALLTREQGKPLREARGEIRLVVRVLEYYAAVGRTVSQRHVRLADPEEEGWVLREPMGVCAAIVPWNSPAVLMMVKVAAALVAGNALVVKPASTTPLTDLRLADLMGAAGTPPGVLNVVLGSGETVGEELVRNPKIRKVAFTGETDTGKHVMQLAARDLKRISLELGGSDPMIVCEDANLELAVEAALVGRFRNCGQTCNSVKRLYLFADIADRFLREYRERVHKLQLGHGLEPTTSLGPQHSQRQRADTEAKVAEAVERGAQVLEGGARPEGPAYEHGYFYLPTLLTNVDATSPIVQEECFGPALPIFTVTTLDEAITQANHSPYGLGASIWTRDLSRARAAIAQLQAGSVWVNCYHEPQVELPFGGMKQSGLGRELGLEGLDAFLEPKAAVINPVGRRRHAYVVS